MSPENKRGFPSNKRSPEKRNRIDQGPPEIINGPEVPILEHSSSRLSTCPGLVGRITELDDKGKPKVARCITCGKKAIIDSTKM